MDFSALKRRMEECFTDIQGKAQTGELPPVEAVDGFLRLCLHMHSDAPDDWADEADDFCHLARELQLAVKQKRIEDAVMLVESLDDARTYCHRAFGE